MYIQREQQLPGRIEEGGRIVITGDNHYMSAIRGGHFTEKAVIQLLGAVARRGGIEDVAGNQQHIYPLLFDGCYLPVQESLKLLVAPSSIQGAAKVPVGCVQQFHDCLGTEQKEQRGYAVGIVAPREPGVPAPWRGPC